MQALEGREGPSPTLHLSRALSLPGVAGMSPLGRDRESSLLCAPSQGAWRSCGAGIRTPRPRGRKRGQRGKKGLTEEPGRRQHPDSPPTLTVQGVKVNEHSPPQPRSGPAGTRPGGQHWTPGHESLIATMEPDLSRGWSLSIKGRGSTPWPGRPHRLRPDSTVPLSDTSTAGRGWLPIKLYLQQRMKGQSQVKKLWQV